MTAPFLIVAADFALTGGMDRANYALADYLARRGGDVRLVAHRAAPALLRHANLRWHRAWRPLGRDGLGWGFLRRAGRRQAAAVAGRGGRVLVNGGNCAWADLNWVHYVHAAYRAEWRGAGARGAARRAWEARKYRRALADERTALAAARVVIANSEATRRTLIERLGTPPERVHTVYYGCDPEVFSEAGTAERAAARQALGWPAAGRTALFVGALGDRRKGFDTLLAAWEKLSAGGDWDLELAVAGRGSEAGAWAERARAAGLGTRCRFLGFRRDVPQLLAASDLLVAPTRYEAYGLGVQEALARGRAALVSADAGVAERYPPELAPLLLHDPNSAEELAARLRAWETQAAGLAPAVRALGARLRARTWDTMAAEIVALAGAEA